MSQESTAEIPGARRDARAAPVSPDEWPIEARWLEFTVLIGALGAALLGQEGYASDRLRAIRTTEGGSDERTAARIYAAVLAALRAIGTQAGIDRGAGDVGDDLSAPSRARGPAARADDPTDGGHADAAHLEAVARRLREAWLGRPGAGIYRTSRIAIDLGTAQGRWELLALAVLSAARVRESIAEEAFSALREEGWLLLDRLTGDERASEEAITAILERRYRAVVSKRAKAAALVRNARRLSSEWGGDLQALYRHAAGDERVLVAALQRFDQLHSRALWLCRVMAIHGGWAVGPTATRFLDAHVRRPLERLGFLAGGRSSGPIQHHQAWEAIDRYFEGDTAQLYRHGKELCAHDDVTLCRAHCGLIDACRFWRDLPEG
ncbi:MAG TPA: hypothetical protein VF234_02010 [Limnochordia bacterium]